MPWNALFSPAARSGGRYTPRMGCAFWQREVTMNDLNWRRGLLRLWLAISVLCLVVAGTTYRIVPSVLAIAGVEKTQCEDEERAGHFSFDCFFDPERKNSVAKAKEQVRSFVEFGVLPPILLLALWFVVLWVSKGFQRSKN